MNVVWKIFGIPPLINKYTCTPSTLVMFVALLFDYLKDKKPVRYSFKLFTKIQATFRAYEIAQIVRNKNRFEKCKADYDEVAQDLNNKIQNLKVSLQQKAEEYLQVASTDKDEHVLLLQEFEKNYKNNFKPTLEDLEELNEILFELYILTKTKNAFAPYDPPRQYLIDV